MKNCRIKWLAAAACLSLLCGCAPQAPEAGEEERDFSVDFAEAQTGEEKASGGGPEAVAARKAKKEPVILNFRDVFGKEYQTPINEKIAANPYQKERFRHDGDRLFYDDDSYDCMLGVDVSEHQGQIDWPRVKAQGYDFAILRVGYRGYGAEGILKIDQEFDQNIRNAQAAGMKVGVYFFAQAINEQEAEEEANLVLQTIAPYSLELPVVYDPESILDDEARTDHVSGEQFTRNTKVFCEKIREAGYEPMIYSNMLWEAFELDLEKLSDYPIWYADYEPVPQTPYDFSFWQYSNEGHVDGIAGNVDLDIWMRKR